MTKQYYQGDTIGRQITFKNESGTLFDPTTIEIDILDPDGIGLVTKLGMSDLEKVSVGTYKLRWTIPDDAKLKLWKIIVVGDDADNDLHKTEKFLFEVLP